MASANAGSYSGIVSAASGITAGIVGAVGQARARRLVRKENKANRQHDIDMMNYQNDLNIANWERQNEYDSPSAQMSRYQDAGLNPNLIYGSMQDSGSIGSVGLADTPGQAYNSDSRVSTSLDNLSRIFSEEAAVNSESEIAREQMSHQKDLATAELIQRGKEHGENVRHNIEVENLQLKDINERSRQFDTNIGLEYAKLKELHDQNQRTDKQFYDELAIMSRKAESEIKLQAAELASVKQDILIADAQAKIDFEYQRMSLAEKTIFYKYIMGEPLTHKEEKAFSRMQKDKYIGYIFGAASQFTNAAGVVAHFIKARR